MSLGNDMPDDPGAPANTDPEGASPNEAEAAVDEARPHRKRLTETLQKGPSTVRTLPKSLTTSTLK